MTPRNCSGTTPSCGVYAPHHKIHDCSCTTKLTYVQKTVIGCSSSASPRPLRPMATQTSIVLSHPRPRPALVQSLQPPRADGCWCASPAIVSNTMYAGVCGSSYRMMNHETSTSRSRSCSPSLFSLGVPHGALPVCIQLDTR